MTVLIVCIGEGKGTWSHVALLVKQENWEKIFLVMQPYFKEKFTIEKENVSIIIIDDNKTIPELVENIRKELDGKLFGDVAVNLVSGSGKEHMAILAALLKIGLGVRLVAVTKEGVKEI